MRTVVTGGSGFIGSHVVGRLLAAGHDVVVIDRHQHREREGARYVHADILDPGLHETMGGADVVFHLAAEADVDATVEKPVETTRTNVEGTAAVLEAARRAGAGRVVLASTVWVYGAALDDGLVPERTAFLPGAVNHVYTASKLAAEMLMHGYHALYGLDNTILRYGIPYGPGMREELVIARFVRQALAGEPLTVAGDGSQYRHYVYVEDLADAHVLSLSDAARNGVFVLEGSEAVSIKAIADAIRALVDDVEVRYEPARPGDYSGRRIESEAAERILGWRPTTRFADGLRHYVEWYREQASRTSDRLPG